MSKDEQPIEGEQNNEQQQPKPKEGSERPAGNVEGAATDPSADDVQEMYDELGINAKAPSGKSKGRPKTSDGGDKKAAKQDDESVKSQKGRASDDSKKQPKATSSSNSDGSDGDDADATGKKVGEEAGKDGEKDGKVSEDGDKDAKGVSKSESSDNGKTAKSGEENAGEGDDGAKSTTEEQGSEESRNSDENKSPAEGKDSESGTEEEQGKRPGKSNPAVEKRMQQLAADRKEALERAETAEKKLQETTQKQAAEKIAQEDPEYKIEDFRKVRDNNTGEIKELSSEEAELAWRRWKDGYDQRATERDARANYEAQRAEQEETTTRQLMEDSANAYDALTNLMDEYPELVEESGKFDEDFAADALPIIQEAIEYLPGTEPGNPNKEQPVIVGLKIDPKKILKALKGISNKKRNLPLNGVNDNAERPSNVSVPHGRSSDSNVNAANELYKELGIDKRL